MKKFILLFAFFGAVALVNVNAQCHGSKASTAAVSSEEDKAGLAKTVSLEEGIEERTDAQTGKVTYVRKEVNAQTGKVTYTDVEYCSKSGKFTNVSPSKSNCCAKGEGAAKATKVANDKKACAEGAKAGCCDKKGKSSSSASTSNSANVKLVKGE